MSHLQQLYSLKINGVDLTEHIRGVLPAYLFDVAIAFRPTWKEEKSDSDESFLKLVSLARVYLERKIVTTQHAHEARVLVEEDYKTAEDKRIIILKDAYPFQFILGSYPEVLFVIYEDKTNHTWKVKAINKEFGSFKNRRNLPKSWAGKRDKELADISGVSDAIFCHNGRFLAVAGSKEGALALAKLALEE